MNKQHVRIFLKIAELGSISGAAQALHYSQPTISYGLAQLEKELGFPLVLRRQGVRQTGLTPAGKAFVPLAQRLLEVQGEISSFIQSQTPNVLRLCSNNTLHSYLIPPLCHRLVEKVPGIDLRMGVWQNNTIPDALTRYFHDIAIYSGFYEGRDLIRSIPFFDEGFCLLCPADTPLPNRTISLRELDPRFETLAADNIVYHMPWAILFGAPMFLMVGMAPKTLGHSWFVMGACTLLFVIFNVVLFRKQLKERRAVKK